MQPLGTIGKIFIGMFLAAIIGFVSYSSINSVREGAFLGQVIPDQQCIQVCTDLYYPPQDDVDLCIDKNCYSSHSDCMDLCYDDSVRRNGVITYDEDYNICADACDLFFSSGSSTTSVPCKGEEESWDCCMGLKQTILGDSYDEAFDACCLKEFPEENGCS
ncbi:hypothetical protein HOD24_03585, partial [Candidatus Peregrinibacteria bacterium]|nr:hypothetical protein [Candidatus Peregrinibacteria bacterium]